MEYLVKRSKRRTLSMELQPGGQLLVRAPLRAPKAAIDAFVLSHLDWIEKARARQKERDSLAAQRPAAIPFTEIELEAIKKVAKEALPKRLKQLAGMYGFKYSKAVIKTQKSRWGSCSTKGNINLNCLLMLCPGPVIDYVLIHELCHLRHMDHSPAFWQLVESLDPDCKAHRKWLKDNGGSIIGRLQ